LHFTVKHSLGANIFPDFTVLRSLKSQHILQIRTNRTEKSKLHMIRPKKHRIQEKEYITVCAKSTGKLTCFKPREISIPLQISCRGVICLFSGYYWFLFDGNKDNHTISRICVQNGCVGWLALVKLLFLN
jgi:hypothetical protein